MSFALASVAGAQESIVPGAETDPVPSSGDAADDAVIWVHPTDPSRSVVIGTDKDSGLGVYDLTGQQLQFVAGGEPNNVDLRSKFPLGGQLVTLVATGDRSNDSIQIYVLDPSTRRLSSVAARTITMGIGVYGCCLYRSPATGEFYFMGTSEGGEFEQWRLFDDGNGRVDAERVRAFDVGGTSEGCVADDETAFLFVGEEGEGVWRYGAEPGAGASRISVDSVNGPNLAADVEGLTIYYAADGRGYLLVSSQGSSTFAVYERQSPHRHVFNFRIVENSSDGIDGVTDCDGIDVMNRSLGSAFPDGLFVVQDGSNPGGNQNFKYLSWRDIATAASPALVVDNTYEPDGGSPPPPPTCTDVASFAYRSGANEQRLSTPTAPILGATWRVQLDCARFRTASVFAYTASSSGTFVPAGEILVDLSSKRLFELSARRRGRSTSFDVAVPADVQLCGMQMFVQGMCAGKKGTVLTNAIDAVVGS